jgi:hypothetical protein
LGSDKSEFKSQLCCSTASHCFFTCDMEGHILYSQGYHEDYLRWRV